MTEGSSARSVFFGIDAGGTSTRVRVETPTGEVQGPRVPSVNPASVGETDARRNLRQVLAQVSAHAEGRTAAGWIGSAAVSKDTLAREMDLIQLVGAEVGLNARIVVSNDAAPLVLGPPLLGNGIAIIVGTGSVVVGRSNSGRLARCGGYEYLISDEGSGFDLGVQGLRAAASAFDRRGPETRLLEMAIRFYRAPVPEIGRRLAELDYPKQAVSGFGAKVCEAWVLGDEVAREILGAGISKIVQGVEAVRMRLHGELSANVVITGGLPNGCDRYAAKLSRSIKQEMPCASISVIQDGSAAALWLAKNDLSRDDAFLASLATLDVGVVGTVAET